MTEPIPSADTPSGVPPPGPLPQPQPQPDPAPIEERLADALHEAAVGAGLLRPVDAADGAERRLWRAAELSIYLAHRLPVCPDPRRLSETAIRALARRWLVPWERLGDPAEMLWYRPYWVLRDGRRIGTLALWSRDHGWGVPDLWLSSVSIFPDARGAGAGTRLIEALDGLARRLGFGALRLETDWLWQRAVRFYLRQGFWVANWKRGMSLIRSFKDPPYRLRMGPERMVLRVLPAAAAGVPTSPAEDADAQDEPRSPYRIIARRRGDTLIWQEHPTDGAEQQVTFSIRLHAAATLSLWLAVGGWPLIRGADDWARRDDWCDVGMPEGLARKIQIFEALARREGLPVHTPRIPGLAYPAWDEIDAEG